MYDKDITLTKRRIGTVKRPILLSRPIHLYLITVDYITGIFFSLPEGTTLLKAKGRISELVAAQNQCTKMIIFKPGSQRVLASIAQIRVIFSLIF